MPQPGVVCVKLIEMGSEIVEYNVYENPTLDGLFEIADREWPENATIRINGTETDNGNHLLHDGDKVYIAKKLKGNNVPFEVQLIKMGAGGGIIKLPAQDGDTIITVLSQLGDDEKQSYFRADGTPAYEYRIGTQKVEGTYQIDRPDGDTPVRIVLSQKLKGNE